MGILVDYGPWQSQRRRWTDRTDSAMHSLFLSMKK